MFLNKKTIEQISEDLSLPFTGIEQDWAIEMANSKRVSDFLSYYKKNNLSVIEKSAVMSLILASYDNFLNEKYLEVDSQWKEIKMMIKKEKKIFIDLIDYWSLNNETDENNIFRITPLIRNIAGLTL